MEKHRPSLPAAAIAAALVVFATTGVCIAAPTVSTAPRPASYAKQDSAARLEIAQAEGTEQPELRPRYEPAPAPARRPHESRYLFALTRGVADSTMHPAGKVLLFPITVPLDLVLLPFEVMGEVFE